MAVSRTASTRPGAAGRPGGPGRGAARRTVVPTRTTPAAARPRAGLTVRAAWLGLVLCMLVLSAAVPLREYLSQRQQISRLQEAQAAQRERIAALEARERELQDPAHVEQEARERFGMVRPGEVLYVLEHPTPAPAPTTQQGAAAPAHPEAPWYSQLWESVQAADAPTAAAP